MTAMRVVVGMSGGVDSSVAALLLKQAGHEVTGVFMKNWEDDDGGCSAEEDAREARLAAATIGIPFYAFNFVREYWDKVFAHFLDEYAQGYTPNPDILCNKEIKFKCFLEKALELDVTHIATGHYARVRQHNGTFELLKGIDPQKDQSYFLYTLGQRALSRTLFPLGDLCKSQVREIAKAHGLPNWNRKDSTGVCFIGERRFSEFLKGYLGTKPGEIRDPEGRVIGRHEGLMFHTIGQRQGLGIGGPGDAWYVAGKDIQRNILLAVQGKHHPDLYAPALELSSLTTCSGEPLDLPLRCGARIRYRQDDQTGVLDTMPKQGGRVEPRWRMVFDRPQRAISPKQSIVLYNGEICLGGGIIEHGLDGAGVPVDGCNAEASLAVADSRARN